jgi:uncharacterized cupredoxin-like copper-binding protein
MTRSFIAAFSVGTLLLLVGCSSDTSSAAAPSATGCSSIAPAGTGDVEATEQDFSIALDPSQASSGEVSFDIKNLGPQTHEFVVFETDLAPDALPTADDGTVDEEGEGVQHIDEVEDIAACTAESLSVNLEPANYVIICNLPGHYAAGMHTAFTVA